MSEDTDLLKMNQELREAVRARDEFLAIAAHELRSPMHALMLQVEGAMLVARRSGSEELLQRLERVRLVLERYVKRATLLLDVSRINADNIDLRFEELDIAEILGETVDTYAVEARKPFPMPALLETVGALLERAPGSSRPTPPRSSSPR